MIERYKTVRIPLRIYEEPDRLHTICEDRIPSNSLIVTVKPSALPHAWYMFESELEYTKFGDMTLLIKFVCSRCEREHLERWVTDLPDLKELDGAKPRCTVALR